MGISSSHRYILPEIQSVEYKDGIRLSPVVADGKLIEYLFGDAKTVYEAFLRGVRLSGDSHFLGIRRGSAYSWQTYKQVQMQIEQLGSFFMKWCSPETASIVGIFSHNRPEWTISLLTCATYSLITVPLYDTFDVGACEHIIKQTEMKVCVCDTKERLQRLLKMGGYLKCIVVMDVNQNDIESATADYLDVHSKPEIISFQEALRLGSCEMKPPVPPSVDSVALICYTSGTTGTPKGVVQTHKNIIANASCALLATSMEITVSDIHLSYLPMAHVFEQTMQIVMAMHGAQIGFYSGDIRKLVEDMGILKPTIFSTVPRLLNRIHVKVQQEVQKSRLKTIIYNWAYNWKMSYVKRGVITRSTLADYLVFRKIQNMVGGRVSLIMCGSAPIAPAILDFARVAFGCAVFEGYGQTEVTAGASVTMRGEWQTGHVGIPIACCMIKLVDVPKLNYFTKNNQGEICVKGVNVMKEYYREPEKTREVKDEDGWLHTGDIGQWLPNGTLKIIDRVKHIFKLSQGEYIVPEKIETVYSSDPVVAQIFVDGNSLETYCVAIVIPDPDVLATVARALDIKGSTEELCKNKDVKDAVLLRLRNRGKDAGLKGFEQVRNICLHPEMLTVESGLLTPTQKMRRSMVRQHFSKHIDDIYRSPLPTVD